MNNLLQAWLLAIGVESLTAVLCGYRDRRFLVVLALINTITNPLLNYIAILLYWQGIDVFQNGIVYILEVAVVIAEWRLLTWVYPARSRQMLRLSIVMNVVSYVAGLFAL
ncbi:MAG: hypothetical protein ACM3MK_03705 [Chitinophagales bacterium]